MQTRNSIRLLLRLRKSAVFECQHLTALDQNLVSPMEKAAASEQNRLIRTHN